MYICIYVYGGQGERTTCFKRTHVSASQIASLSQANPHVLGVITGNSIWRPTGLWPLGE